MERYPFFIYRHIKQCLPRCLMLGLILGLPLILADLPVPASVQADPPAVVVKTDAAWFVDLNRFAASAHGSFKCEDCHGGMIEDGRRHPDSESPMFLKAPSIMTYDYSRCQKCHQVSYQRYLAGGHARARDQQASGNDTPAPSGVWPPPVYAAPACGACHPAHTIASGLSQTAVNQRTLETCGQCHPVHAASYLGNIHGRLAINLNHPTAASCTDCHGAHTVTSLRDRETALAACRRCHSTVAPEFADIVIHANAAHLYAADAPKSPALRWIERVRLAALGVVAVSLVFFFGHSFLWLLREIHEKLRKH